MLPAIVDILGQLGHTLSRNVTNLRGTDVVDTDRVPARPGVSTVA
jgi:hypothetical protein